MYGNNFVLTILRNGKPQKEMDGQVGLPFDTEYKIRLKNKNCRQALAKVSIDGTQVCGLGDFVVGAYSSLDLSRFVDTSLSKGRKFKFVSLDHSEVDDPTSSENGIIKVEFRLEKQTPCICIDPVKVDIKPLDGTGGFRTPDPTLWIYCDYNDSSGTKKCHDNLTNDSGPDYNVSYCSTNFRGPAPTAGATVGGKVSKQQFYYVEDFDTENTPTVLTLKLVSSGDLNNKKTVSAKISRGIYCSACGNKIKFNHKFCSSCGSKLE